ncbi:kinase-like domain-containing protein [Circinella umbellata]|nr:kinase-like domain-containing protein [Circinella umbellata]
MNRVINEKYKLDNRVGGGSYGDVYIGHNVVSKTKVAVKVEDTHSDHEDRLSHEYKVNKLLSDYVIIPKAKYFGAVDSRYNAMVMELMGPSLEDLFSMCKRKFNLKTVLMLGKQMLLRLETMHKQGWVHRDIKPDNFAMGVENGSDKLVHILDFGLAKRFKYEHKNVHVPFKDGRSSVIGTARYTSINSHLGVEQTRRDDLEALGYTLVYFFRGKLPWQGITRVTTREKYHAIYCQKDAITIEELCKGMPKKFIDYFDHVYNLDFSTKPDYKMLRQLFKDMLTEKGFVDDNDFEWLVSISIKENQRESKKR